MSLFSQLSTYITNLEDEKVRTWLFSWHTLAGYGKGQFVYLYDEFDSVLDSCLALNQLSEIMKDPSSDISTINLFTPSFEELGEEVLAICDAALELATVSYPEHVRNIINFLQDSLQGMGIHDPAYPEYSYLEKYYSQLLLPSCEVFSRDREELKAYVLGNMTEGLTLAPIDINDMISSD